MNIPKGIRIDTVNYTVEKKERLIVGGKSAQGCITYSKHLIEVEPDIQDEQGMVQTLWHEILHGIMEERALDFKESSEETLINELSKGIFQVIKDNAELLRTQGYCRIYEPVTKDELEGLMKKTGEAVQCLNDCGAVL